MRTVLLVVLGLAVGAGPASAAAKRPVKPKAKAPVESDVSAITKLITAYAQATDLAAPGLAALVWANSPAVSFIHPKGEERGWEAIKTNIYEKMMGETFSERKLTVKNVVVHSYGAAAWAELDWELAAKLRKDGAPFAARGRETQVYRKTKNRWELVHVHDSALPATGG